MAQALVNGIKTKLEKGHDCPKDMKKLIKMGVVPPVGLVLLTFGDRSGVSASPETLKVLLEARADPNADDPMTQTPLLHTACWKGPPEIAGMLLDYKADLEAKETKMNTPVLNTALAAGNAKVCLELLNRNASVQWTHHDGATPLHVATAWIASAHNAHLRLPPVGEEPLAVIHMMLHNGVDPMQREGMTKSMNQGAGMTPLEIFRREVARSPWRSDEQWGAKFDQTASKVYKLLEQAESAVGRKQDGNKAFKGNKFLDALEQYEESRKIWEAADVRGHHVAVLWSNEAQCLLKLGEWDRARCACEEGLTHYCTPQIKKKLEERLQEAETAEEEGREQEPKSLPSQRKPPSKLSKGYLEASEKPLYGDEGSVQGKVDKPGPFICHFEDAKEQGFVDGVDGWKDRKTREDQALDRELVKEGLMAEELLDDPKSVQYINPLPPGVG